MSPRRAAGLTLAVALCLVLGCGGSSPPPPPVEEAAEPEEPSKPIPAGNALVVFGVPSAPTEGKASAVAPPKPGEMALPEDGGPWPWKLAPAPEPRPTRPVAIGGLTFPGTSISGLAVSPAALKAVVTVRGQGKGKPVRTRVVWCDLAAGSVLAEWELTGEYAALDLAPDGRRVLAQPSGPTTTGESLSLWTITDANELKRRSWTPHEMSTAGLGDALVAGPGGGSGAQNAGRGVAWAAFASERVVTAARNGQLRVWDPASLKQLGTIDAAPARPALTPDGAKVVFLTQSGAALLDPAEAKVVAIRRTARPPEDAVLAVNPGGTTLAVAGTGRANFLDLASGAVWAAVIPKLQTTAESGRAPHGFGWAGDRHLFADHLLYDPDLPVPAWDYANGVRSVVRGREVWVVVGSFAETKTLRSFVLPHPAAAERLTARHADPGLYTLRPGDGVRIDVSGIPAERQADAAARLDRRLRAIGYRPDPGAAVVLQASEERAGRPQSAQYWGPGGGRVEYTERPARLKLVKDGRVLWEAEDSIEPDGVIFRRKKPNGRVESLEDVADANGWGMPDYKLFDTARIPPLFLGPKAPVGVFGRSEFQPDGLREVGRPR